MQEIWTKIKFATQWVWNWITVITTALVGVPEAIINLLNAFAGVDITPFVGADTAVAIISIVAIVKALLTLYVTGGKVQES